MPKKKKDVVPFDWTESIKKTQKQRDDLEKEVVEIDDTLADRKAERLKTGLSNPRELKQLNIRRLQNKQRCLELNKRLREMREKQEAKKNGDSQKS